MSEQLSPLFGVDKKLRPLVRALIETAENYKAATCKGVSVEYLTDNIPA